jgi:hypothetical protein
MRSLRTPLRLEFVRRWLRSRNLPLWLLLLRLSVSRQVFYRAFHQPRRYRLLLSMLDKLLNSAEGDLLRLPRRPRSVRCR